MTYQGSKNWLNRREGKIIKAVRNLLFCELAKGNYSYVHSLAKSYIALQEACTGLGTAERGVFQHNL